MPITFPPFDLHLLFKGVFDYQDLYKKVNDWLIYRGYQLHEIRYEHKDHGRELRIDWDAWKKINEVVKFKLLVHYQVWEIEYVNVTQPDGQVKKLMKARMYVRLTRNLDFDYTDSFGKSTLKKHMLKFLYQKVFKEFFDSLWEDNLRFKMYELQNVIKEVLDMQTKGNEHWDVW